MSEESYPLFTVSHHMAHVLGLPRQPYARNAPAYRREDVARAALATAGVPVPVEAFECPPAVRLILAVVHAVDGGIDAADQVGIDSVPIGDVQAAADALGHGVVLEGKGLARKADPGAYRLRVVSRALADGLRAAFRSPEPTR